MKYGMKTAGVPQPNWNWLTNTTSAGSPFGVWVTKIRASGICFDHPGSVPVGPIFKQDTERGEHTPGCLGESAPLFRWSLRFSEGKLFKDPVGNLEQDQNQKGAKDNRQIRNDGLDIEGGTLPEHIHYPGHTGNLVLFEQGKRAHKQTDN